MTINSSQIKDLLLPGLAAITGDYAQYPSQWSDIFEVYNSDKAQEREVEMKFLGLGQLRPEGSGTAFDSMGERVLTTYTHRVISLGFAITHLAQINNLYKSKFPLGVKSLKKSMAQTKEVLGASVLNNGFSASFPIGDGRPLFDTAHPIDTGTVSNTLAVPADLGEAPLESAILGIRQFRDQSGLITMAKPTKLIVAFQGEFVADRLLGSAFRTGVNTNDISAVYNTSAVPEGYRVNQFINLPNFWMVMTDASDGFKHYVREGLETDMYTEFSTDNLLVKATEIYSFGVTNFRGGFGVNGP